MHCVCEPSTLHFPAASAEHLGVTSLLRGEKVSPSGGISHPRRGWGGAFLLQASVFDSVRWTKKALEICAVGVFGIAVAAQGLSQQLLGFPGTGPGR